MELGKLILDKRVMKEREMSEFEECLLDGLWNEISRIYWNHYQEEFSGYGSGEDKDKVFSCNGIKWTSYDWSDEPSNEPNFTINGKNFWWYKYFGRGMTTDSEEKLGEEWFEESLKLIKSCEKEEW